MPRDRRYVSNADRQAAYRVRVARRAAELEAALGLANRRADEAEHRAERAEHALAAARDELIRLRMNLAALQNRQPETPGDSSPADGRALNRQARRQAEREARRRRG